MIDVQVELRHPDDPNCGGEIKASYNFLTRQLKIPKREFILYVETIWDSIMRFDTNFSSFSEQIAKICAHETLHFLLLDEDIFETHETFMKMRFGNPMDQIHHQIAEKLGLT